MIGKALYSSELGEWETPLALYAALHAEFAFNLDPAATVKNAKCPRFYTKQDDGLSKSWKGERVWLNPPYGRGIIEAWVEKAATGECEVAVLLLPARTDTKWFQTWVLPFVHDLRFIRGRVRFVGAPSSSPFPSVIVVYQALARKAGTLLRCRAQESHRG